MASQRVGAVIPAAGKGTRIGGDLPKQFIELAGKPIVLHVLEYIQSTSCIDAAVVVAAADCLRDVSDLTSRYGLTKVIAVVEGGAERQDSVWKGLQRLADADIEYVAVHDGVRPFLDDELVHRILLAAKEFGAAVPAVQPRETVKQTGPEMFVADTPPRNDLWLVQTPQIFEFPLLYRAYQTAMISGYYATDDAGLVEKIGGRVKVVDGSYDNIKITTREDLDLAQIVYRHRHAHTDS